MPVNAGARLSLRAWGIEGGGTSAAGRHRPIGSRACGLRRITDLIDAGVNLAGIAQILHLQTTNTQLETDNAQLRATKEADHDRAHPRPGEMPMLLGPHNGGGRRRRRGGVGTGAGAVVGMAARFVPCSCTR